MKRLVLFLAVIMSLSFSSIALADDSNPNAHGGNENAQGANRQNGGPADPVVVPLTFWSADDVASFVVSTEGRNATLAVDTLDCCIAGDSWGIRIIDKNGVTEACGSGSTSEFSGTAVNRNLVNKEAVVEVFYCGGVDSFPAGLTVQFRWSGPAFSVEPI
jgi:hypothetical protein